MTAHVWQPVRGWMITGPKGDREVFHCQRCGAYAVTTLGVRMRADRATSRVFERGTDKGVPEDCDEELVRDVMTS